MRQHTFSRRRRAQHGFVAAYLIAAIAMFSLVAWAASQMIDANVEIRWVRSSIDALYDQTQLVRKVVIDCGTNYPDGDNGDAQSLAYYKKYPASSSSLASIQCPGAPIGQQGLLTGRDGVFLSKLPPDFGTWSYANTSAGITITLETSSTRGSEVIASLANRLGSAESSVSGNQFTFVVATP